jgi:serine/threonine protein kinase
LRHVSAAWEHLFPEPGAVAPEHIAQGSLGPHTDVYGLGVLLYLMTTTALPFGGSAVVAYNSTVAGNHSPNPRSEMGDLSEEFAGLVERCLARVPADRPSSMAQVIQELQAFVPNQEVALSQIAPVLHGQSYLERFEPLLRLVDGGSDNEEETAIGPPPSSAVIPLFEADWNQEFVSDAELLARMTPEQRRVYMRDIYGDEIPSGSNKGVYWGLIVAAIILSFALSWMTATPHQESVTESSINWSTEMAPLERRPPEETTERRKRKAIILYR